MEVSNFENLPTLIAPAASKAFGIVFEKYKLLPDNSVLYFSFGFFLFMERLSACKNLKKAEKVRFAKTVFFPPRQCQTLLSFSYQCP